MMTKGQTSMTQKTGQQWVATMMSEQNIWRTALRMIARYGSDAALVAGERSDALTKDGRIDESETWQRILAAILCL
jgi:hypothetical protein